MRPVPFASRSSNRIAGFAAASLDRPEPVRPTDPRTRPTPGSFDLRPKTVSAATSTRGKTPSTQRSATAKQSILRALRGVSNAKRSSDLRRGAWYYATVRTDACGTVRVRWLAKTRSRARALEALASSSRRASGGSISPGRATAVPYCGCGDFAKSHQTPIQGISPWEVGKRHRNTCGRRIGISKDRPGRVYEGVRPLEVTA